MFVSLISKEIRNHLQTFKFSAALITTFVLIITSVWVLGEDFNRRRDQYNKLAEQAAQQTREIYIPSRIRPIVHRPPSPLGIFAQGDEKRLGNSIEITRWQVPTEASDSLTDNVFLAARPSFDLLAVVTLVVSLFAILLSYDSISGERQRGTLKLLCTYPPGRGTIITAKFTAGIVVLSIPFLLSFLIALLLLQFVHGIVFTGAEWSAAALMAFTGILYAALFLAIGLMASAMMPRSSAALVLSLLIWGLGVLLLPNAATSLASTVKPLLPPTEITTYVQRTNEEIRNTKREWRRENAPNAGSGWGSYNTGGDTVFLFDSWPDAFFDTARYVQYYEAVHQQHAEDIFKLKLKHLERKIEQASLADMFAMAAPATHLRRAFSALAATDYRAHADFLERARRYRRAFLNGFQERGYFDSNVLGLFSRRNVAELTQEKFDARRNEYNRLLSQGAKVWDVITERKWPVLSGDHVPPFENGIGKPRIEDALGPIAVIAVMTTLIFFGAFVAFVRYDVR